MPYPSFNLFELVASLSVAAVAGYLIFDRMKARQTKKVEELKDSVPTAPQEENPAPQWSALELVAGVLKNLNCKIEEIEHGFQVRYQSELFGVYGVPGNGWVEMVDYAWFDVPTHSRESACLLQAVNEANADENVTAFCITNERGDKLAVMSKTFIIVPPDMPHLDEIVPAWLAQFFKMKRKVMLLYEEKIKNQADYDVKPMGEC